MHRILQSLAKENIVSLMPKKGYGLTPRLISIGLKGIAEQNIVEAAIPAMRWLSLETHETISLHVISGYGRVCLYRLDGDYPIPRRIKVGDKDILFRGAPGKIFAATFAESELKKIADQYIRDGIIKADEKVALFEEIREIKAQGYATSRGERIPNSGSIGVPVKDFTGNIQTALVISTIIERMTEENLEYYLQLLFKAAEQIHINICHGK